MKRKPDLVALARRARHLTQKLITGEELARRLKVSPETAQALANVGCIIELAEANRLSRREREVMKVIARVTARKAMLEIDWCKTSEINFGKRSNWCGKSLVELTAMGLITMPIKGRLALTGAGFAFVWEAGFIKPSWKVPT